MVIRKDLIREELQRDLDAGFTYSYRQLSNRFLDKLYRHYYVEEMCENFYDSEPPELEEECNEELYNMYMDYARMTDRSLRELEIEMGREAGIENPEEFDRYSSQEYTMQELRHAYIKVKEIYEAYEPERMEFLAWQEPRTSGRKTEKEIRDTSRYAREILLEIKKKPVKKRGRLFVSFRNESIVIYWFGRDISYRDYWFIFCRKADKGGKGKR